MKAIPNEDTSQELWQVSRLKEHYFVANFLEAPSNTVSQRLHKEGTVRDDDFTAIYCKLYSMLQAG